MDTLLDVQNRLYKLYDEARKKYPLDKDWIPSESYDDISEEPTQITDRLVYMVDEIKRMNDDDFLSLMSLYYLTYSIKGITNEELTDELCNVESEYYDEIIDSMVEDDREVFLDKLRNDDPNESLLTDMISIIMYQELLFVSEKEPIEEYDDYGEWDDLISALNSSSIFRDTFKKIHPDLESENEEYKKYKTQCYNMKKLLKIIPRSTMDFITIFMQAKKLLVTKQCTMIFLEDWMDEIKEKNPELIKRIMIIIHRYYYVKPYLLGKGSEAKDRIAECMECIDDLVDAADIIDEFVDFDLIKFNMELATVKEKDLKVFDDLINVENTKVYGNNGVWKKYEEGKDLDCVNDFYCRCNSWIDAIGSISYGDNKRCAYVYFTEDKDMKMNIPRILFIYDCVDNELVEVLGRNKDGNVELELVEVLEEKLKDLGLLKNNEEVINSLKDLNLISIKIRSKIPLTNEEIDMLYQITKKVQIDFDCNIKRHHFRPTYLSDLRKKSGDKQNLAQYFNCSEDEVVVSDKNGYYNWNDNMVVTTELWHDDASCNYPNLKAVLGCLMANTLQDAYSLDNLEIIGGDVFCGSLKSSEHLEKLTRIGGVADFSGMIDTSHFNPDLVIEKTARFKDDKKPNIKILNKDK